MKEKKVKVVNKMGVHARPASLIVQLAQKYEASAAIIRDGNEVNAKSILSVMMLAAEQGSELTIRTDGPDEEESLNALYDLFNSGFGEYLK